MFSIPSQISLGFGSMDMKMIKSNFVFSGFDDMPMNHNHFVAHSKKKFAFFKILFPEIYLKKKSDIHHNFFDTQSNFIRFLLVWI